MSDKLKPMVDEISQMMSEIEDQINDFSDDSIDPQIEYDLIINETNGLTDGFVESLLADDDEHREDNPNSGSDQYSKVEEAVTETKDHGVDGITKISDKSESQMLKKKKPPKFVCPLKKTVTETKKNDSEVTEKIDPNEDNENNSKQTVTKKKKHEETEEIETKKLIKNKSKVKDQKFKDTSDQKEKEESGSKKKSVSKKLKHKGFEESKAKKSKKEKHKKIIDKNGSEDKSKNKSGHSSKAKPKDVLYKTKWKNVEMSAKHLEILFGKREEPSKDNSLSEVESMYAKQCEEWFRRDLRHKNYNFSE